MFYKTPHPAVAWNLSRTLYLIIWYFIIRYYYCCVSMKSKTVLVRVSLATAPAILIDCLYSRIIVGQAGSPPAMRGAHWSLRCPPDKHHINPRLPAVFRVTLLPEVRYIIPQNNLVKYAAPRIEKANFSLVLHVFEVKESISDIFTERPCLRDSKF